MVSYEMLREKAYSSGKASDYNELCNLRYKSSNKNLVVVLYGLLAAGFTYAIVSVISALLRADDMPFTGTNHDISTLMLSWTVLLLADSYLLITLLIHLKELSEYHEKIEAKEDKIMMGGKK